MTGNGPEIAIGSEFSHYRIISKVDAGGMGAVYLADDLSLGRKVAVKVLSAASEADPDAQQHLLTEARHAATVDHPAVVAIHEFAFCRNRPVIVMEYVDGDSLATLIERGPLPADCVTDIARQLFDALAAIHSGGLRHGDIKPANLMLDRSGRLRLLDFGVARIMTPVDADASAVSGTVRYAAPEVLTGGAVDARADLFSAGVVLYELLTGRPPFTGPYDAAVSYSIVNEAPTPIASFAPQTPPPLDRLVMKLLAKHPEQRPRSAGDVLRELQLGPGRRTSAATASGRRLPVLAVSAVVIAVVSYLILNWGSSAQERPTLAVLPFQNLGQAGEEYFADGVTDEVATGLARNPRLNVISRNSSMKYKNAAVSTRQIGRELGADYVVQGTVHWERSPGNRVRINAQLIRVRDDVTRWSQSYDGELNGIFDMQRQVAQSVTAALDLAVAPDTAAPVPAAPTDNLVAYDYYLQGNEYFNRSWTRSDIEIAGDLYRKAVARDSNFASAWAMLSRVEASMYWEYYDRDEARCRFAYEASRRALALRPDLPEGYAALGFCYYHCDRDYDRALAEWQRGLVLDPNNSQLASAVGAVLRRQGLLDEAVAKFIHASELDTRSHLAAFDVALTYGMMRRFTESDRYLRRAVELAPDHALSHIYRAWLPILQSGDVARARRIVQEASAITDLTQSKYYWWLLRILEPAASHQPIIVTPATDTVAYLLFRAQAARLAGRTSSERLYADSARVLLERKMALQPGDSRYLSEYGLAWAGLQDKRKALDNAARAVDLLPASREAFDTPFYLMNLAEILVVFGDYDSAVAQLETLLSIPGFASASYLQIDPLWKPLRGHPAFRRLVAAGQSES